MSTMNFHERQIKTSKLSHTDRRELFPPRKKKREAVCSAFYSFRLFIIIKKRDFQTSLTCKKKVQQLLSKDFLPFPSGETFNLLYIRVYFSNAFGR